MTGNGTRSVITLGESLVLLSSVEPNGLLHSDELGLDIGGAESNFAIALSRLGTPVMWLGRVGDDNAGRRIVREMRAENVDVHEVVDSSAPTGLMLKERLTGGVVRVAYYRTASAGSRLEPDDVPVALIEQATLLHVTGITMAISDSARRAVHAAVDVALDAGVPVSFDVNHRANLLPESQAAALYRPMAELADIVFAGEEEARLVLAREPTDPVGPDRLAEELAQMGRGHAIVKRGSLGSVLSENGEIYAGGVHPVQVVDPVGAGDAFVAGYLSEYLRGSGPSARLRAAAFAGAMACSVASDWRGAPFAADLARLATSTSTPAEVVLR